MSSSQFNTELSQLEEKYRDLSAAYDQYCNLLDTETGTVNILHSYIENGYNLPLVCRGWMYNNMHIPLTS